jgi:hypothetical protein
MVPAMPALGAMMPMRSGLLWAKAGKLVKGCAASIAPAPPSAFNTFLRLVLHRFLLLLWYADSLG